MNKLVALYCGISFVCIMTTWAVNSTEKVDRQAADLVVKNAKIVTIDKDNPRAEALAVIGEWIVAVGSNDDITPFIDSSKTTVIDAGGRLVIPGFNDAHCHFNGIDPNLIDLRYVTDPNTLTLRVKEKVARAQPGELISGRGWEHEQFPGKKWPTKELLDPVSPNNPVVLERVDGHSVLVNSYVLRLSGITRETADPAGGEIQRDAVSREPTGILKETAVTLVKTGVKEVQETADEEQQQQLQRWQAAFDMAARLGVTSIQLPPGSGPQMYRRFQQRGQLTLRVYFGADLTGDEKILTGFKQLAQTFPREGNWIRFGYLKGYIDGTLGSGTALLHQPYADDPDNCGLPQYSYPELERMVITADKMGFQIGIHAIGTKANTWVLDAYTRAQQVNGRRDSRHRIEHAQILISDDIPRFAQLNVIASMQPTHCITDKRFCEKRIGHQRSAGAYAWRSLLINKARIAFGTDYPVEPLDPLEGIYAAVTRKDRITREEAGWFPEQCLTVEEAITCYTLGSAYAEFMEDRKGMLKVNYLADLVIYEDDLLTMPATRIMENRVDYTILDGKIVYRRDHDPNVVPKRRSK
jgi:predicted amidohydrolase YtcJ